MIPLILSVALVLMLVLDATVGTARTKRMLATFEDTPANRVRYYRLFIALAWARAAAAMLVTFTAGLSLTDIGVSASGGGPTGGAPDGGFLAWLVTVAMSLSTGIGAIRARRSMRAGQANPLRARTAALIPRTARERRYAVAVSVTAGITEEIFFRGALIALGIEVFHLPVVAAAALSLVLFIGVHAYQGRLGMLNVGFLGLALTALPLAAGSLLPAIVLHIATNLWAFLVVPAEPTPRPTEAAHTGENTEAVRVGESTEAAHTRENTEAVRVGESTEAAHTGENTEAVRVGTLKEAAPFTGAGPAPGQERPESAPLAVPTIRSPAPAE